MSYAVLISEPEKDWAKEMQNYFLNLEISVECVYKGKDVQLALYKGAYSCLILDLETKNHSALEVLKYIRLNNPGLKVILTVNGQEKLDELTTLSSGLNKLGAHQVLIKPYAMELLHQAIVGKKTFENWKTSLQQSKQITELEDKTISKNDDEFTRLNLETFQSGNHAIFDCYVRIDENQYVQVLSHGDSFDSSLLKKYKSSHNITHLYFQTKDRTRYIEYINEILAKLVDSPKISGLKKVVTAKEVSEKYIEEVYSKGLRPELIEEGKNICANIYNMVQRDKLLAQTISQFEDEHPHEFRHMFLVAFYAAIICSNLSWSGARTMELVVFGALLHDLGKLKLKPEIQNKRPHDMTSEEHGEYQNHSILGFNMLEKFSSVPESVKQIIFQHHEMVNGSGFPNGISGGKIYPLAKIVSLADGFAHFITEHNYSPLDGIKKFIPQKEQIVKYDPFAIKALVKGFVNKK